ncbi:mechanosensitive ion channel [Paraburkholderia sp. SARCC-3016]|uniref:mechanosensitive ion channel family protein n=1 Tax=Paraburkholderia sp. SARCC-3016 TaxID=3058611 RepID=UPI0028079F26|nr:mechanosensitive ion channel domain-containing protein [Paraburkholderia sp. SARCC-3016]MDQ7976218.1 mechanosensitive ion channel [Paraburkholderia sp. SARCC-3016]
MRKLFIAWLLIVLALPALAAAPTAPAAASAAPPVKLTPDQARQALEVLNDPQRRAQVTNTLHAIAAAGALAAPPVAASPAAAASAAPAAAASTPLALKSNGLAAQIARQGARWLEQAGISLKHSLIVLLDTASVRAWWRGEIQNPQERAKLAMILSAILGTLLPAIFIEWVVQRLLRRARAAIAARRLHREAVQHAAEEREAQQAAASATPDTAQGASASAAPAASPAARAGAAGTPGDVDEEAAQAAQAAGVPLQPGDDASAAQAKADAAAAAATAATAKTAASITSTPPAAAAPSTAPGKTESTEQQAKQARSRRHAAAHWTLLQRLPLAALHLLLRVVPLAVFVIAASVLMSILAEDGSPQDRALSTLIDLYVLCRSIVIACGFFLQPDAPALRLWRMPDRWAIFVQRWAVWIVGAIGCGAALVEIALALGLSESAHVALVKLVALAGHVLLSLMILQCRTPVAEAIRARAQDSSSPMKLIGEGFVDLWTGVAVFIVMALWFVWALDVQNGYRTLLHLGGISVAVLIGARVVSIVVFGALGRIFRTEQEEGRSLVHQHAYRYYPFVRRIVYLLIAAVTVLVLLQVWHVDVWQFFATGTIGHRLASAIVTIFVAAVIALFIWEAVNVSVERRLARWTQSGDLMRAARLRTLLPMLRTALFVVIALVVVMTGLSELGVNTAPLLASASIFGVALGFGSQKLVQDFITGIFLLMENAMQVGDWVTLAGVSGTVEYLSIRTVRLRGGDGSLYTVPFSSVSTVNNTNRGLGNAAVRVSIVFGADLDLAIATLKEIGTSLREDDQFKDGILSDFAFWGVDAVDGASVTLAGQVQCRDSARWGVQREFNRRIFQRFSERGIAIANPQRQVLAPEDGRLLVAQLNGRGELDDRDDARDERDAGSRNGARGGRGHHADDDSARVDAHADEERDARQRSDEKPATQSDRPGRPRTN